ncbi:MULTISPECIES: hypothetical protein [Mameliella]|uniref:hypothetical protein n=1 Tax=Mameliella TaxID=1434019 RepID=UPI0005BC022D|nr:MULTISPECIES: hypothetical protein [Mameliella]MDD9730903.1 hypothetical protein [Mameliella sp. AT18]
MSDEINTLQGNSHPRAKADIAADRICLCCRKTFPSAGFGERICPRCKGSIAWRGSVPEGVSTGRRRGGRSA